VGKIAKKAVCRSVFFTIWHFNLSAELTETHSLRLFFGNFVHWRVISLTLVSLYLTRSLPLKYFFVESKFGRKIPGVLKFDNIVLIPLSAHV